jgi:two-component system, chemotaxis family, chemotaxis protein CheY
VLNMKLLIVDDEATTRTLVKRVAVSLDVEDIIEANDGKEALEKIAQFQPDIVVLDWNMPVMDGKGVLENLKLNPPAHTMSVMMLTIRTEKENIQQALQLGATDYVVKPIQPMPFKVRLEKFIKAHTDRANPSLFDKY